MVLPLIDFNCQNLRKFIYKLSEHATTSFGVHQQPADRRIEAKCPYPYKEGALEEPFLNVLWVAIFSFVQAPQPVVIRCAISVSLVTDFGPNAGEKIIGHHGDLDIYIKYLHQVFPIVLDWAE